MFRPLKENFFHSPLIRLNGMRRDQTSLCVCVFSRMWSRCSGLLNYALLFTCMVCVIDLLRVFWLFGVVGHDVVQTAFKP